MKKKHYYAITAILVVLSCNPPDLPVPTILSVAPVDLHPGSNFIIKGQFLQDVNYVFLDGISFMAHPESADSIRALIPRDIPAGTYSLFVMTNDVKSNSIKVIITPAKPHLGSISPPQASVSDTLIISGYFFENNQLTVHIADMVFEDFIEVNDSIIKLLVTEEFKPGQLTVVNTYGSSTSLFFNFNNGINKEAPNLDDVNRHVFIVGDTLIVTGGNFSGNPLSIVFPDNIHLQENIDFHIVTDELLTIRIPVSGISGDILVSNEYGEFNISVTVIDQPVISIIRPRSNKVGGPMLIYGKNLGYIEKIELGNSKTIYDSDFEYLFTSEGEEIIALKVPDVQAGEIMISLLMENDKIKSGSFPYTVLSETMTLPAYLPTIVLPNPPQVNILDNLNNQWLKMDQQSRIFMNVDKESTPGEAVVIYDQDNNAGTVNNEDNSITLTIDSKEYYGKLDNSFKISDNSILRLILTPVEEGNQIEMVFPYYLASVTPESVHPGDSITVSGRYFKDNDQWGIKIGENITIPKDACRKISDVLIRLEIPGDIEIGEQSITISNESEFYFSNSYIIQVVSK